MRISIWVVLVFLVGIAPSFAQIQPQVVPIPTDPMELSKLPPAGRDAELDTLRCGNSEYFLKEDNPRATPRGVRISVLVDRNGARQIIIFLREKYRVVIDESRKIPTVEYGFPRGAAGAVLNPDKENPSLYVEDLTLTVRISRAEYTKAATCLPTP